MEPVTLSLMQRGPGLRAAALFLASVAVGRTALAASQYGPEPGSSPPPAGSDAAWVEMTGAGAVVRANAVRSECPPLTVDGREVPMEIRARADAAFPETLCQARLPARARRVELSGRPVPAPKARIDRIVVLGDTGCRLKGLAVQNCNDARAWPFAQVARLAAAEKPDLVIHVGDYYYRETACPLNWSGCEGSPHGDASATWAAEFFEGQTIGW